VLVDTYVRRNLAKVDEAVLKMLPEYCTGA